MNCFGLAGTSQIGIGWLFDAFSFFQHHDMFGEQTPLKGIRMIEVNVLAFFHRDVTTVFVV